VRGMQDVATWQAAMEGSRPGPGAERPVGCHLGASQLNSAERGAESGCVYVSEYGAVWSHVSVTTRHLQR
jgi:hypothetical protein